MDEPLSNLDAKLRGYMRSELKRLQADLGVTTIYVTHDQIEAMTLAHRVAVMNKGVVQQIATPREIYDDPANLFVAGFIGSPPMNTIRGSVGDGCFVLPEGRIDIGGYAPAKDVILGFRPEDARIMAPGAGCVHATVFACELTGNETIVTCTLSDAQVVVKMDKDFDVPIDAPVGIQINNRKACLFDPATGERVRA
jgi:multiple sugar transport system ATP-binding protein